MRCPALTELPPPPPGRTGWPWTEGSRVQPDNMPDGRSWPRISIVTPSFNQGQFLEETIRSVLLQGYPDLEYIIMDGGSTDESLEIIRRYEPWLAHWVSEPDAGQTDAINKGWSIATGEAITWLNSDDLLLPGSLALSSRALFARPDIALVYGHVHVIDEHSSVLRDRHSRVFAPEEIIVSFANHVNQPGFLARRVVIEAVGWLDNELHYSMDFDLWTRLTLAGAHRECLDEILACFREHKASKTSTSYRRMLADVNKIYEKVFLSGTKNEFSSRSKEARSHVTLICVNRANYENDAILTRAYAWRYVRESGLGMSFRILFLLLVSLLGGAGMLCAKRLWLFLRYSRLQ